MAYCPKARPGLAEWERRQLVRARYQQAAIAVLAAEAWGYFLTLTFKRHWGDAAAVHRLVTRTLRRWFRGRRWLMSVERHRSGSCHVHVLLHADVHLRAVERFCRWWGVDNREGLLRGAEFVRALNYGIADLRIVSRHSGDWERVVAYATKYVLKTGDAEWGCNLSPSVVVSLSSAQADCWPPRYAGGRPGAAVGKQQGSTAGRTGGYLDSTGAAVAKEGNHHGTVSV